MRVLSLFSGVGGFDMGLEAAGMTTVFQCEIDKHARAVLDHRWPDVPKWDDVSTLTGAHILEATGGVNVVAWGSPCQDLSLAGKRKGLAGERSGLFHQGMRIIRELRELSNGKFPTWSIWENVYGALSSNGGADFGEVLYEMDEAGACFSEWAVLDAQYFGVPQRRRRVFVTSCFDSGTAERCPSPLLPVSEGLRGDSAKGAAKGEGASGEVAGGFGGTGWPAGINQDGILGQWVTSKWHKGSSGPAGDEHHNLVVEEPETYVKVVRSGARDADGNLPAEVWRNEDVHPTLSAFDIGDTRTVTAVVEPSQPLLVDGRRVDDVRVYTEPVQTLAQRMGTGGNNVPVVAHDAGEPIVFQPGTMVRLGGGVWEGGPVPTLRPEPKSGDNSPHVAHDAGQGALSFDTQFGSNANVFTDQSPTLKASQQPPPVAHDAEAYGIQGTVIGRSDTAGPAGRGYTNDGEPRFTLDTVSQHGVAITQPPMIVRRLTPLECERLMGWPDNHTAHGTNGPISDTQRYRMCGNGVASPVAQWIGTHILHAS